MFRNMAQVLLAGVTQGQRLSENFYENRLPPHFGAGESGFFAKNGGGAMKRKALRIMAGLIAEKRIAITLANSDHAAADVRVLYDSEENVIKDTYPIYHKQ